MSASVSVRAREPHVVADAEVVEVVVERGQLAALERRGAHGATAPAAAWIASSSSAVVTTGPNA